MAAVLLADLSEVEPGVMLDIGVSVALLGLALVPTDTVERLDDCSEINAVVTDDCLVVPLVATFEVPVPAVGVVTVDMSAEGVEVDGLAVVSDVAVEIMSVLLLVASTVEAIEAADDESDAVAAAEVIDEPDVTAGDD